MSRLPDELVFVALGGVGEIGMNLALYGFGPPDARQWLAVDIGISFPGPNFPGVDVILPDIRFLEGQRKNLLGIVITHAHEDHYGALSELWPRLRVPVFASPFTAGLLEAKRTNGYVEPGAPPVAPVPITIVRPGDRRTIGPFEVEFIAVAHSIPEPMALAIRTPLGTVIHTGDWKLDPDPVVGPPTDGPRLAAIGDEGVLALICDSTNAMREGESPSEADVARELETIVREAHGRVAFTAFASNVARLRSIALAAAAADRQVIAVGRAIRRVIDVAGELGYLAGLPPFLGPDAFAHTPSDRCVTILTGSQGEPRAALARVAEMEDNLVALAPGDLVVFSSRPIPGNEKPIIDIINRLVERGVKVITDRDRLVHVSGHPRRAELEKMYRWTRPRIAIPVHGEAMHLAAHSALARDLGVREVMSALDGKVVRLAPGRAEVVDHIPTGRVYRDGSLIGDLDQMGVHERRRLSFAGHVSVSIVMSTRGDLLADPEVALAGLPEADRNGHPFPEIVEDAVDGAFDSIPKARRKDRELVAEAVRRSVRAAVREAWGKKPVCTVLVSVV